jgi:hypothetical protein
MSREVEALAGTTKPVTSSEASVSTLAVRGCQTCSILASKTPPQAITSLVGTIRTLSRTTFRRSTRPRLPTSNNRNADSLLSSNSSNNSSSKRTDRAPRQLTISKKLKLRPPARVLMLTNRKVAALSAKSYHKAILTSR